MAEQVTQWSDGYDIKVIQQPYHMTLHGAGRVAPGHHVKRIHEQMLSIGLAGMSSYTFQINSLRGANPRHIPSLYPVGQDSERSLRRARLQPAH